MQNQVNKQYYPELTPFNSSSRKKQKKNIFDSHWLDGY